MEPMNLTLASEDCNLYTYDMRRLQSALCVHKVRASLISSLSAVRKDPTSLVLPVTFHMICRCLACMMQQLHRDSVLSGTLRTPVGQWVTRSRLCSRLKCVHLERRWHSWHIFQSHSSVACAERHVQVWDPGIVTLLHPGRQDFTSAVMDVDYSPTGREFVAGSYDRSVRIFGHTGGRSREVSARSACRRASECLHGATGRTAASVLSRSMRSCVCLWPGLLVRCEDA